MHEMHLVFIVLGLALIFFVWGKFRYDIVAVVALLSLTLVGIIPADEAFYGFGHPAVITVAAVLIISRSLENAGIVDMIVRLMSRAGNRLHYQMAALVSGVTLCSAFMNNIGALALFMPVSLRVARKSKASPSIFLMPLAFGSLLGGLMTQIGTPPNIIISLFREDILPGSAFGMFDFLPVGAVVAAVGALFIIAVGWRLIPQREAQLSCEDLFAIDKYLTEVYVPESSKFAGKKLLDLGHATEGDIMVVGHVRNKRKMPFLTPYRVFDQGDNIIIKATAEDLKEFLDVTGFELTAAKKLSAEDLRSAEIAVAEAVVTPNASLINQSARSLKLRSVYGVNLLGISRAGARLNTRPDRVRFQAGDVIMLQGRAEILQDVMSSLGCLPLVERGLKLQKPRRLYLSLTIFGAALAVTALGLIQIQVAFMTAAVLMLLTGVVGLRELYGSIDWPVIVLLGAMLPISKSMETTGGAAAVGGFLYGISGDMAPWLTIAMLLLITMLLSNIVNNAAAALLLAPIALSISTGLDVSPDPMLMTVAVGASCAFLTPIGHQSNTLVMGPGGYHFGDYWRMGLPLSVLILIVAVPIIMLVWPL